MVSVYCAGRRTSGSVVLKESDITLTRSDALIRNGRAYQLVATASDGSALYESRLRRREFWLQRAEGGERPWNYRTHFGRRRPLPPPEGGEWRWL